MILLPLKNALKYSRRTFTRIIQQLYDLFKGIQLTLNMLFSKKRNHESFEISSSVIYHCFQIDYLKPRLKLINLGTNITIVLVCSFTRSFNPFSLKMSI